MPTSKQKLLVELRDKIAKAFNEDELEELCFNLEEIDFESLRGDGPKSKARSLVSFMHRTRRLDELLQELKDMRPQHKWPSLESTNDGLDEISKIELLVNGVQITRDIETRVRARSRPIPSSRLLNEVEHQFTHQFKLEIGIHNASGKPLTPNICKVSLHTASFQLSPKQSDLIRSKVGFQGRGIRYNLREPEITFPDEWDAIELRCDYLLNSKPTKLSADLILLTKSGSQSYSLLIEVFAAL